MRSLLIPGALVLAACADPTATTPMLDVGNPGNCDNFQSPREVGDLATYSPTARGLGYGPGPRADTMSFTVPGDGYGRTARSMTLELCDEHYHDPIEHPGACSIPVVDEGPGAPHETTPVALATGDRPAVGTLIELHTAYAERVDRAAKGLARCQGVVFVRASQWEVADVATSDELAYSRSSHYAGSATGAGDEACKPPVWWEVVDGCFQMSKDDARLAAHPKPARALQTYLSPMKWIEFL